MFGAEVEAKRPTVQVGDPFTEKLLIEACLELMATDAIVAIQDMGAAGLTSSSVEMAGKGGLGIELDLDKVPTRETGMNAYEIMLSESQERMLMILKPGREDVAKAIFEKWELDFAVIGITTDTNRLVIKLQPEDGLELQLLAAKGGLSSVLAGGNGHEALSPVSLDLDFDKAFPTERVGAYERLLLDALAGRLNLFVRSDEQEQAWRWVQPILDTWAQDPSGLRPYAAGTWGPPASSALVARDSFTWPEEL